MIVWSVGDSAIRAQAAAFATAQLAFRAVLVDTTTAGAIPETVWTEQIHEPEVRRLDRSRDTVTAVLYLPQTDYDSENTVTQVKRRLPPGSRIIAVVPAGTTPATLDGFTHETGVPVSVVPFGAPLV